MFTVWTEQAEGGGATPLIRASRVERTPGRKRVRRAKKTALKANAKGKYVNLSTRREISNKG